MLGRITFKKAARPGGLAGVVFEPYTDVKVGGLKVGTLHGLSRWEGGWSVSVMVKQDGHPGWRWVKFKGRYQTEQEARAWVLDGWLEKSLVKLGLTPHYQEV